MVLESWTHSENAAARCTGHFDIFRYNMIQPFRRFRSYHVEFLAAPWLPILWIPPNRSENIARSSPKCPTFLLVHESEERLVQGLPKKLHVTTEQAAIPLRGVGRYPNRIDMKPFETETSLDVPFTNTPVPCHSSWLTDFPAGYHGLS